MSITHLLRTALLLLAVSITYATAGHAVQPQGGDTRADVLFNQAAALEQRVSAAFPRHVRRTARLYIRSAELRDASDPLKIESLQRAGGLLMSLEPQRAHRLLAEAAELALTHGDVVRTAHLYLDGAWVVKAGRSAPAEDVEVAKEYLRRALILADAPTLSAEERDSILKRVRIPTPSMMAAS